MSELRKKSTGPLLTGVALLASAPASAELIITEKEIIINDGFEYAFDLNGDDINDFKISVGPNPNALQASSAQLLAPGLSKSSEFPGRATIQGLREGHFTYRQGEDFLQNGGLKKNSKFVYVFDAGDDVDGTVGRRTLDAKLYGFITESDPETGDELPDRPFGPFAEEGDRGFVGLSIQEFNFKENDFDTATRMDGEIIHGGGEREEPTINYGWVELVRGSINVLRIGYQQTVGAAAPIPGGPITVSEPATLPLITLGAAGLVALRRRKTNNK